MQRGLVICYSQTGQTREAVEQFCSGLTGYQWSFVEVKTKNPYSFPWKITSFFRLFSKCVTGQGTPLLPIELEDAKEDYSLVVLAYQVWFLSMSLPMQSVLADPKIQNLLKGKKVLSIVTCRNMWVSAVTKVNKLLNDIGVAKLKTLVLCDLAPAWATFVTTPRWLLTGKKGAFWIFPEAGIARNDFQTSREVGKKMASQGFDNLDITSLSHKQSYACVLMEKIGYPVFVIWANFIELVFPKENFLKDLILVFFRLCLVTLILVLLPLTAILQVSTSWIFDKQMNGYLDNLLQE